MTYRYLTDLADVLRTTGRKVVELPGWKSNGRPDWTGSFNPIGNLWHHTGSYDAMADAADDLEYAKWLAFKGRSDLPAPLCGVAISAEGVYYVCAAGRANHAGTARRSGPIPSGDGNALLLGWECMNSGSQGWSEAQYGAMVDGGAVTSKHYGWTAAANRGHCETSVTGKWDPGRLDLDTFRTDIKHRMNQEDDMTPAQEKKLDTLIADVAAVHKRVDRIDRRVENQFTLEKRRDKKVRQILKGVPEETVEAVITALTDDEEA